MVIAEETELVIAGEIMICCFLIQWIAKKMFKWTIWQHCLLRESVS